MMSGDRRGFNFFSALKIWPWRSSVSSPLTANLLDNPYPPAQIELTIYGGEEGPRPGCESPSGFLRDESLSLEPISDLDFFFERVYCYYCGKGLWGMVTKWVFELLTVGFMICFSGFFLLFVDWKGLSNAKCGIDAVGSGVKPCDLVKEAINLHPLVPFTFFKGIVVCYLGVLSLVWVFFFIRFFVQLKNTLEIRRFYHNSLNVTDHEVQTTPWESILEKIVHVQNDQQLCVVKDLSAHDIVMRIMRKENYLIGMINKGVLSFQIPWWMPGVGPAVTSGLGGGRNSLVLTKTLHWIIKWFLLQSMFDRNFRIKRDFVSNPSALRKRLIYVGLGMVVLSPCLLISMLVYLFLSHAEQFYHHPSLACSRRWSNLSKWIIREFNEVDHLFTQRINSSVEHAANYLKQFPSPIIYVVAKFVSFVAGGFAAVLIIIAFLEESLLEGHIFGRNLLWYAAVFGTVTAISRAAISEEHQVLDPEEAMSLVVQHTHYMPKSWRGKENTSKVRKEFEALYQYTGMLLLEEMVSILLTPYLLIFSVPKRVADILQFVSEFTVAVDGVGDVCSLSLFDFERHGNSNYASPFSAPRNQRSSQGKMEKSFVSFKSCYQSWEPSDDGKIFITTLQHFCEEQVKWQGTYSHQIPHIFPLIPNQRTQEEYQNTLARGVLFNRVTQGRCCMHSLSMDQRNPPYLLDWYYTFHKSHPNERSIGRMNRNEGMKKQHYLFGSSSGNDDRYDVRPRCEEDAYRFCEESRYRSHIDASTSNPFLRNSVLNEISSNTEHHANEGRFWARTVDRNVTDPQSSFIEPPIFGNHQYNCPSENFSERSEQEEYPYWKSSYGVDHSLKNTLAFSQTRFMDGYDEDELGASLPFDDVYQGAAKNLRVRTNTVHDSVDES